MLCHAFENFYIEFLQKIHTPDETVSSVFNCHLANLNKVGLKPAEQKTVSAFFQPSLLAVMKLYNLHFFVLLLSEIPWNNIEVIVFSYNYLSMQQIHNTWLGSWNTISGKQLTF